MYLQKGLNNIVKKDPGRTVIWSSRNLFHQTTSTVSHFEEFCKVLMLSVGRRQMIENEVRDEFPMRFGSTPRPNPLIIPSLAQDDLDPLFTPIVFGMVVQFHA